LEINNPETLAEVTAAFHAYERAFVANDLDALDGFFWESEFVLRYGVAVTDIARANQITNTSVIYAGQRLTIPGLDMPRGDDVQNPLIAAAPVVHRVNYNENLIGIANFYGVTVSEIMRANNISNMNLIYPGQELQIWPDEISTVETEHAGDLPDVSGLIDAIEAAEAAAAPAGEPEAAVPAAPAAEEAAATPAPETAEATTEAEAEATTETETETETETVRHIVQRGEFLSRIASQYNVSWSSIAQANGIVNPNNIYAGMELIIPGAEPSAVTYGVIDDDGDPETPIETVLDITSVDHPGPRVGVGRELIVILSTQTTYAYEDGELKGAFVVSTGLPATPTVQGNYRVYAKYDSQTMSGPGYYLPGVQWIMYFYAGYAFHGAYWHENFGQPMSRGCVNMTNEDALWLYNFASVGTPVHVRWSMVA